MKTIPTAVLSLALPTLATTASLAQTPQSIGVDDENAIQALVSAYARNLGACAAEDYADLFAPGTGYFASGFRGQFTGREKLIALVQSERQCTAPAGSTPAARPGGAKGPTVEITVDAAGVHGVARLGTAEYEDAYTKTSRGWVFASRTVVLNAEKEAGIDAGELLAIYALHGDELGDNYVPDDNGVPRLLNSGVSVSVTDGVVHGKAYLKTGGYRDEVYEKTGPGKWRIASSTFVAPQKD
jgi:SnoaL-like domain